MKRKLLLGLAVLSLIITACNNPFFPEKKDTDAPVEVIVPHAKAYTIVIDKSGDEPDDAINVSPDSGIEGDTVTLTYKVADTAHYNLLDFSGVTTAITSVESAGSGERTYVINVDDASDGTITIIAVFEHTNLELDPIAFTDNTTGHINKTYGDAAFTNAIKTVYSGSGAITYSSENPTVATVNSSGQVTILKAGSTVITAEKAADDVYAHAQAEYTLAVNPKPVTITGLSASNKQYDGTTTATVTGTAVINGKIDGDDVSVVVGTAAFASSTVGNGKTVTFSGWSLTGEDAGNYSLSHPSITANIVYVIMVPIPAGTFTMGSPTGEPNRQSNETEHSVTLRGFNMGKYQVTQALYELVMGTNPSHFTTANGMAPAVGESDEKRPVENVTWYDTVEFCNKLSVLEGLQSVYTISGRTPASGYPITSATVTADFTKNGYRLPTEAQWEYACRAGTTTAYNTGANISDNTGWYRDNNAGYKTHQVGLKQVNAWGLYDMHGNVSEWCWDWYDSSYYSSSPANDPTGAATGTIRVVRGGYWLSGAQDLRSAYRVSYDPGSRNDGVGFRLVCP